MDLQLKGKTAVITGATIGIGRAIAEAFADEGANVAICSRNADRVAAVVKSLRERGVKAFGCAADAGDRAALQGFVGDAAQALGGIDILVSNASSLTHGAGENEWRNAFNIDMMGAVWATEVALPYLEKAAAVNGDAAFLAISSMAATQTMQPDAYGAMKAALINYAKGLSVTFAPKKVRVNTICPGTVLAEGGSWDRMRAHNPEMYETMVGLNPTGRMGRPEEIAAAVVFLSSPRSSFTTGANLVIDGSMGYRVNY